MLHGGRLLDLSQLVKLCCCCRFLLKPEGALYSDERADFTDDLSALAMDP